MFPSSREGMETPTLLGPLERANFRDYSLPSPGSPGTLWASDLMGPRIGLVSVVKRKSSISGNRNEIVQHVASR
jgi:hypothetical protein